MTILTPLQVADYWVGAGGPRDRAVEWVAIAMGESGLRTDALSPAGARGVWQIMPFNAGPYGYSVAQLDNPAVNANIAVAMSGGGTNCAAWDSAYLDIQRSGRYKFLAWPEQGSADYQNLPYVAAYLSGHGLKGISPPSYPGITGTLEGSVAQLQKVGGQLVPAQTITLKRELAAVGKIGTRGWRP